MDAAKKIDTRPTGPTAVCNLDGMALAALPSEIGQGDQLRQRRKGRGRGDGKGGFDFDDVQIRHLGSFLWFLSVRSLGTTLFIAIATPHLLLPGFAELIYILMLLDVIAALLELFYIREADDGADSITAGFGVLSPMVKNLDLVFSN